MVGYPPNANKIVPIKTMLRSESNIKQSEIDIVTSNNKYMLIDKICDFSRVFWSALYFVYLSVRSLQVTMLNRKLPVNYMYHLVGMELFLRGKGERSRSRSPKH